MVLGKAFYFSHRPGGQVTVVFVVGPHEAHQGAHLPAQLSASLECHHSSDPWAPLPVDSAGLGGVEDPHA